jgi:lipopolysaccharide biosynthesis glycosyltransferase
MKDIIIFAIDDNYIDYVKSVSVNCREQGAYTGDFAIVCTDGSMVPENFPSFTIMSTLSKGFFLKFDIFDSAFKYYDRAIYLDCDVIVQDNIYRLFDLLKKGDLWMDTEDLTTMETFWRDEKKEEHPEVYALMNEKYPHVKNITFNSSVIVFNPQAIPDNTPRKLADIQKEIEPSNKVSEGGTDQQVINLYFGDKIKKIPEKMACFWGCDEPQNQRYSESRGWIGDERPVILHMSRWYAQWIEKTDNMDAYYNHKLKIPCFDLYIQNLTKFNDQWK